MLQLRKNYWIQYRVYLEYQRVEGGGKSKTRTSAIWSPTFSTSRRFLLFQTKHMPHHTHAQFILLYL